MRTPLRQISIQLRLTLAVVAVAWLKRRDGLGGAALAIAILLKAVGWIFIPLLFYQQRWRFLACFFVPLMLAILLSP